MNKPRFIYESFWSLCCKNSMKTLLKLVLDSSARRQSVYIFFYYIALDVGQVNNKPSTTDPDRPDQFWSEFYLTKLELTTPRKIN